MKPTQEELNEILRLHGMWLRGGEGGVCANLRRANLSEADLRVADLRGANLNWAIGNMVEVKSLQLDTYAITYWLDGDVIRLAIGCQSHTLYAWKGFSDAEIRAMDGRKALEWWMKWKDHLLKTIEMSPPIKGVAE